MRINWARCVLVAVMLMGMVILVISMLSIQIVGRNYNVMVIPLAGIAARVAVVWILIGSADIRRLCSRRDG